MTYDLTGLPPTPEALDDYLADTGPDAYSRLVDRLLASPRFGERMASLWLPLARYAEDQAHQVGDDTTMAYPNAHLYREWVIDAFNRDLPYDQFLRFQLAADKIEGGKQHLAALGFPGTGSEVLQPEPSRGAGRRMGGPGGYGHPDGAWPDGRVCPMPRPQ